MSVALIIQALFFGDGGILAIFANCFNMAIVMPFVGYGLYRLLAGRSAILSSRRAWAGGIAAYVGDDGVGARWSASSSASSRILFTENGHALYSPYGLSEADPGDADRPHVRRVGRRRRSSPASASSTCRSATRST